MGFRMIAPKRIRKAKTKNSQEVLRRIEEYLKSDSVTGEPVEILCGFWEDQQNAITYQELRQAVIDGAISQETLRLWSQDYSVLVTNRFGNIWENAIAAGSVSQPMLDNLAFELNMQNSGILNWISERGAEFVTASTQEQKEAIAALLAKKMRDGHTVDELSRLIRPCIGLTEGDAKAAVRLYDSIVANLKKEHPRMKIESIRRKALDATQKYAERKHRQRAMTIAQTESAFAYNRGADEGIRQAQAEGYLGMMKKRWCTSGDDAVCDLCNSLEGAEVDMDSDFKIGGRLLFQGQHMLPPAHPRCACAVEYIEVQAPLARELPVETIDMEHLANDINNYIGGGYSIKGALTDIEYQYIKDNSEVSSITFYRIEDNSWTASNLAVGDSFSFRDDMKSFTRSISTIERMLVEAEDYGLYDMPVVFKTLGSTYHFDVTPYSEKMYEWQHESWISGEYRVLGIGTQIIEGRKIKCIEILQMSQ